MRVPLGRQLGKRTVFLDGAMGTQLFERGAQPGGCNELLNIEKPQIVEAVHQAYFDAGGDAVLTNTFGANPISLRRHGLEGRMREINLAAAAIARKAAGEDRYIIGDIGPTGDFLEPLGTLKEADLFAAYAEQAKALEEGGVDGFIVETMMALDELTVAVKAIKSVTAKPVFASMAFDSTPDGPRTMMGVTPKMLVDAMTGQGVRAVGFNCGTLDMDGYVKLAQTFTSALFGGYILLIAQPNAGRPELVGDKAVYHLSPAAYAEAMVKIRNCGAAILGGCCGTSPAHLEAAISANQ